MGTLAESAARVSRDIEGQHSTETGEEEEASEVELVQPKILQLELKCQPQTVEKEHYEAVSKKRRLVSTIFIFQAADDSQPRRALPTSSNTALYTAK